MTLEGGESEILVSGDDDEDNDVDDEEEEDNDVDDDDDDDDDEDNAVDQTSFRGCGKPGKHWDGSKVEVKQPPKVRTMMTLWMMTTNTTTMALSKQ